MTKNIIIAILAIATVGSLVFGVYQKTQAEKNAQVALEMERRAQEMQKIATTAEQEAMRQRALADAHMAMAEAARAEAEKRLAEALRKKGQNP